MHTQALYAVTGYRVWATSSGQVVAAPELKARLPIVQADVAGQFSLVGTLFNPTGKGPRAFDLDARWLSLDQATVQAIIDQGKADGSISAVRTIDRFGSRGAIPRNAEYSATLPEGATLLQRGIYASEPGYLVHLGASKEGLKLASSLGLDAQQRVVIGDDGGQEIRQAEIAITASAVAALVVGAAGPARNTESNPALADAIAYIAETGMLPPRTRPMSAVRQGPDSDFASLFMAGGEAPF